MFSVFILMEMKAFYNYESLRELCSFLILQMQNKMIEFHTGQKTAVIVENAFPSLYNYFREKKTHERRGFVNKQQQNTA